MYPVMPCSARTAAKRDELLDCLEATLEYFTQTLGGRLVSVSAAEQEIRQHENLAFSNPYFREGALLT